MVLHFRVIRWGTIVEKAPTAGWSCRPKLPPKLPVRLRPGAAPTLCGKPTASDAAHRLDAATADGVLDELCERRGVRLLALFGSAVHGPVTPASDLDVAIEWLRDVPGDLVGLVDDLVGLTGIDRVDVAVLNGAGPTLRARAFSGRGLYEDVRGAYAFAQMAALAQWRDTAGLRRLDLRRMAG